MKIWMDALTLVIGEKEMWGWNITKNKEKWTEIDLQRKWNNSKYLDSELSWFWCKPQMNFEGQPN